MNISDTSFLWFFFVNLWLSLFLRGNSFVRRAVGKGMWRGVESTRTCAYGKAPFLDLVFYCRTASLRDDSRDLEALASRTGSSYIPLWQRNVTPQNIFESPSFVLRPEAFVSHNFTSIYRKKRAFTLYHRCPCGVPLVPHLGDKNIGYI